MVVEGAVREMTWVVCVAVKEYHTSSLVPVALQFGAVSVDAVAPAVDPCTGVAQVAVADGVNVCAPAQSSLVGTEMTQMLKVL